MRTKHPRRGGFSLIEILVVIALLALLAAIGVGAYFRVQAGAEVQATEGTLNKLNVGIVAKWKAVLDRCTKDALNTPGTPTPTSPIPAGVFTYAGGDRDRARVIWTYMKLRSEFPTRFSEATTGITVGGVTVPPRDVFGKAFAGFNPMATDYDQQSAACLYVSLTRSGVGGVTFDADPLQNQTKQITVAGITAYVFVDAWGSPISFLRMAYTPELDGPPYTRSNGSKDPVDPPGKLDPSKWTELNGGGRFWDLITRDHRPYAEFLGGTNYPIPTRNWIATPISAGPNGPDIADAGGGNPFADGNLFGGDNLVGFRLRKEGQRGD